MRVNLKQYIAQGALSFLFLSLVACQSATSTPPTIVSSIPATGAVGVEVNTKLSITFSKALDKTSLKVTLTPSIKLGMPIWNDEKTLVFDPVQDFQENTSYTLTIAGKDVAGLDLSGNTTIAFTTVLPADTTAPAVPAGFAVTAGDSEVLLEWQANTEADLLGYTVYLGTSPETLLARLFIGKTETTATILGLENGTAYSFAIDAQDELGNQSDKSVALTATPKDTTAPSLVSSEPANLSQDLSLIPTLRLTFSEAMDTSSVEIGLCVSDMPVAEATCDAPIPVNFAAPTWSEDDTQVRFTPTDQFQSGKTHVLVIAAKDKAGNALSSPNRVAFSMRATPDTTPPTVTVTGVTTFPISGTGTLFIAFSEAMDQKSVQDAFLSQPAVSCAWTWEGNQATCQINSGLKQLTSYMVTLGTQAKDSAGNPLAAPYQFPFVTQNFAPRILSFSPSSRFGFPINVSVTAPIVLTFSEPMDKSRTQDAFEVKVGTVLSALWAGTFEWNTEGDQMTYRPNAAYGNGATVTWTISTVARELSVGRVIGLGLPAEVSSSFSTQPIIGFSTSTNPSGGQP